MLIFRLPLQLIIDLTFLSGRVFGQLPSRALLYIFNALFGLMFRPSADLKKFLRKQLSVMAGLGSAAYFLIFRRVLFVL